MITVEDLKHDYEISVYLSRSTEYLGNIGFTEHGKRHAGLVSKLAYQMLKGLEYP